MNEPEPFCYAFFLIGPGRFPVAFVSQSLAFLAARSGI